MNKTYVLVLKLFTLFAIVICQPAETLAGPNGIYGVKKSTGSRGITGTRSGKVNSGKLYGDHGSGLKNNYFGKSTNSSSKPKKKDSPPATWNDVYKGQRNSSKTSIPPDRMEAF